MTAVPTMYAFEVAAFQTVNEFPGGARALGPIVGINGSVLAHKASLTDEANQLTVLQARKVMQATGDCRMLLGLAQDLDHVCIAVAGLDDIGALEQVIAASTQRFGEYLTAVSAAVSDGVVTTNELRRIDKDLGRCQAELNRLRAACAARMATVKGRR